jgi:L-aspartate semialdehyde sulfurtransferase ferredoxin
MATRKVMLKYPEHLIQEPVLFRMVRQFDVVPNIRRARVTETVGEIALELEGTPENLERGVRYLQEQGVDVTALEGDVVSP